MKGTHNMSYENAPQTHLLATHCFRCGKELCDAHSVEVGMGPVCRVKTGYNNNNTEVSEEDRKAANKLIHTVATTKDTEGHIEAMNALMDLGFEGVVKAMVKSLAGVTIAMTPENHPHGGGRLAVKTAYNYDEVSALRGIKGRRWDKSNKVNTFPVSSKNDLWEVLKDFHDGELGLGPKGLFKVQTQAAVQKPQATLKVVA